MPDADETAAAALQADAENRGRHIQCQATVAAAIACFRVLMEAGLLTPAPSTDSPAAPPTDRSKP